MTTPKMEGRKMSCHEVRSHISRIHPDEIFCTRDVLHLSSRNNVDQTLFRLVRQGALKRLARGVFVRNLLFQASPSEIAKKRAVAFGKQVEPHAAELLEEAGLHENRDKKPTLALLGRAGGFLFGPDSNLKRFVLAESCPRKIGLAQTDCGRIMRSIWHLQKENCTWSNVNALTSSMTLEAERQYPNVVRLMPGWLSDYFYLIRIGRIRDAQDAAAYWSKFARFKKVS